jgi:hypothetical protein
MLIGENISPHPEGDRLMGNSFDTVASEASRTPSVGRYASFVSHEGADGFWKVILHLMGFARLPVRLVLFLLRSLFMVLSSN